MGGSQNYGPHMGPLNIGCRVILRSQKKDHNFDTHPYTIYLHRLFVHTTFCTPYTTAHMVRCWGPSSRMAPELYLWKLVQRRSSKSSLRVQVPRGYCCQSAWLQPSRTCRRSTQSESFCQVRGPASKYQHNEDSGVLYRRLLLSSGPSTHDLTQRVQVEL